MICKIRIKKPYGKVTSSILSEAFVTFMEPKDQNKQIIPSELTITPYQAKYGAFILYLMKCAVKGFFINFAL